MRDALAERLLARLLEWDAEDVARERPLLQALAAYKYDEYQQFSAGSRFIENLMLWLNQFRSPAERRVAYDWFRTKLVFCSSAEMRHLVEMAYPDHVRPLLRDRVAVEVGISPHRVAAIAAHPTFAVRQRQCIFLGLSDGARIDAFRRANCDLDHEQIWQTYELSDQRVDKLLKKLKEHLEKATGSQPSDADQRFRTLVLLDDFSASGTSYYAQPAAAPAGGKVFDLFTDVCDTGKPASRLVDLKHLNVVLLLYMATEQALTHLQTASEKTWGARGVHVTVEAVQRLREPIRLFPGSGQAVEALIGDDHYYDPVLHDSHFAKGGTTDARYGYAACGLPLVLHHNSPNNSVALLMSYERLKFRGLFPRVQRHREIS
jgi:hypothetical protein